MMFSLTLEGPVPHTYIHVVNTHTHTHIHTGRHITLSVDYYITDQCITQQVDYCIISQLLHYRLKCTPVFILVIAECSFGWCFDDMAGFAVTLVVAVSSCGGVLAVVAWSAVPAAWTRGVYSAHQGWCLLQQMVESRLEWTLHHAELLAVYRALFPTIAVPLWDTSDA